MILINIIRLICWNNNLIIMKNFNNKIINYIMNYQIIIKFKKLKMIIVMIKVENKFKYKIIL